jgi:glycerate kinase
LETSQHPPRRFLVAPDSFKGTIPAAAAAAAIGAGLTAAGARTDLCPVADGGEGTAEILRQALGGRTVSAPAHDPLGRPTEARFAVCHPEGYKRRLVGALRLQGPVAAVDVAAASGLPLVAPAERDAERASSRGSGELVAAAIDAGARTVLVAAGGSASTDGGLGAIEAIEAGGGLRGAGLEVLCDVRTPFEDAARVFAPQKGADAAAVARLGARLERLARELPRDPTGVPMSGCAGGLSGGLWAAFDAGLRPGAAFVLDLLGFDRRLGECDAVISGEGRLDAQSFEGKIVGELASRCAAAGRPLHLIVGQNGLGAAADAPLPIASITEAGTAAALTAATRRALA